MIEHHAAIARTMAEQLSLPDDVVEAIGAAYERWDGRGWPGELEGDDVPLAARVAQVAEYIEVANRLGGVDAASKLARERRGGDFDPVLAGLVETEGEVILSDLDTVGVWGAVIDAEPGSPSCSGERIDEALLAIANFVDLKSPYFLGHARAVSELAAEAGRGFGLTDDEVRLLAAPGWSTASGGLGSRTRSWTSPAHWAPASGSAFASSPTSRSACCASPRRSRPWPGSRCSTGSGSTARATRAGSPAPRSRARRASSPPRMPTRRCASRVPTVPRAPPRRPPRSCGRT